MNWLLAASSRQNTIMDDWTEYLCVRPAPNRAAWEVAICGYNDEGNFVPMTDASVASVGELSDEAITDAIDTIGWQGPWDVENIVAVCLQRGLRALIGVTIAPAAPLLAQFVAQSPMSQSLVNAISRRATAAR